MVTCGGALLFANVYSLLVDQHPCSQTRYAIGMYSPVLGYVDLTICQSLYSALLARFYGWDAHPGTSGRLHSYFSQPELPQGIL
jgi:hypothetical protein